MKKIIILALLVCLFPLPAQAINGHIALNYDTMTGRGQGEIYLYEEFLNDKLLIGGRFITGLKEFSTKDDWIPSGVPESQTYDLIIEYKTTDNITLIFTEGCKHYFSQSDYDSWDDEVYIKPGIKYEF